MVALQMVQDRPSIFRRMILVGTGPRGGEDIMHLEKPSLAKRIQDPANRGYDVLTNAVRPDDLPAVNATPTQPIPYLPYA